MRENVTVFESAAHGSRPADATRFVAPYVVLLGEDRTWFRRDYERAFSEAGFEVAFIPTEAPEDGAETGMPGDGLSRARARIRRELRTLVAGRTPALLFCYAYDRSLDSPTLRLIRRLPCPSVLLHVDLAGQWYHVVRCCSAFTLVAAAQRQHTGALKRRAARVLHWPMAGFAAAPDWETPRPAVVRFVGSPSASRVRALSALVQAGVPTEIFGRWPLARGSPGAIDLADRVAGALHLAILRARRGIHALPALLQEEGLRAALSRRSPSLGTSQVEVAQLRPYLRGPVAEEDLQRTLAGGQLALGCTDTTPRADGGPRQMRLRDFEAPLSGACYLTQESPGLAEAFEIGHEVLVWDTVEDLVRQARELLAAPERCLHVAHAGWERSCRDHTYQARLHALFRALGMSPAGATP